jgi:hypothetical protein
VLINLPFCLKALKESLNGKWTIVRNVGTLAVGYNILCIGLVVQTRTPPGSLLQISKMPLIKFGIFGALKASLALMFLTKNLKYAPSLHSRKRDYYSYLGTSLSVEGNRLHKGGRYVMLL